MRVPFGPPPAAGFIDADDVEGVLRAVLTAAGLLLVRGGSIELRTSDGSRTVLAAGARDVVLADSRGALAVASGRRLHLVGLPDGARETMPGEGDFRLAGAYGRALYAVTGGPEPVGLRWTPGSGPEPLPYLVWDVDRETGTLLVSAAEGRSVLAPDGSSTPVGPGLDLRLAPGGGHACALTAGALTVFDGGSPAPRVIPLPNGLAVERGVAGGPVWEDEHRLLLLAAPRDGHWSGEGYRVDVRKGVLDRFLLGEAERPATLVEAV